LTFLFIPILCTRSVMSLQLTAFVLHMHVLSVFIVVKTN